MAKHVFFEVADTVTASRWQIWKARMFGKCSTCTDDGYQITTCKYKGVIYITSFLAIGS